MRPILLLALLLCGCAQTTAPVITKPIEPALIFKSACDEVAVWEFYLDGQRLGLYAFSANAQLTLPTTNGLHAIFRTEWKPTVQDVSETVTVRDTTRISMNCR